MTTQTAIQLTPSELEIAAKVVNWEQSYTTSYTGSDIETVKINHGMVNIYFLNAGMEIIDIITFRAKVAEFRAEIAKPVIKKTATPFFGTVGWRERFTIVVTSASDETGQYGDYQLVKGHLEGQPHKTFIWYNTGCSDFSQQGVPTEVHATVKRYVDRHYGAYTVLTKVIPASPIMP